jgi:hypothetical protein
MNTAPETPTGAVTVATARAAAKLNNPTAATFTSALALLQLAEARKHPRGQPRVPPMIIAARSANCLVDIESDSRK